MKRFNFPKLMFFIFKKNKLIIYNYIDLKEKKFNWLADTMRSGRVVDKLICIFSFKNKIKPTYA